MDKLISVRWFLGALLLCGAVACSSSASDAPVGGPGQASGSSNERKQLAKGDSWGSCDSACGGQSEGTCWCDAQCTDYGDCCDDYVAACVDDRDLDPDLVATINGIPVEHGQVVVFVAARQPGSAVIDGVLTFFGRQFLLEVACTDDAGNVGTASALVRLRGGPR